MPSDFNNVATDPTEVGVATMLPQQYRGLGIVFDRTSGWVVNCPPGNADAGVGDTLRAYGCISEFAGTYFDSSQQIQVAVWVIPLPDKADAEGAYNTLTAPGTAIDGWGTWCPATGVTGSRVCQEPWQDATQGVWTAFCHRYLVRALALYVDLSPPPPNTFQHPLRSAAYAADSGIGAQGLGPIAQCWPSTAITAGT